MKTNPERQRLLDVRNSRALWRKWGPYLSERQWGTVREDYSAHGAAWDHFPHDHARSRAYRWGEDGIAGISDEQQRLCFAVAMWNGHDPILKERLFGLTGPEGNHGEDVKELYWYLDATPTSSYLRMLYKYPQAKFPYCNLVKESRRRGNDQPEYELLDTGIFNEDRYFDVFVEYAKAGPEDLLIRIIAHNRGPEAAPLWLLPQAWFRNTWSWGYDVPKPLAATVEPGRVELHHAELGGYQLYYDGAADLLFCDNETNARRLWGIEDSPRAPKDAFHEYIVGGKRDAVSPDGRGTKVGALYQFQVPAGDCVEVRLRLRSELDAMPFDEFDSLIEMRRREADAFYAELLADVSDADERLVARQAFAGMIWSKQFYYFDIPQWLSGDPGQIPPPESRKGGRNREWQHLNNADIISMPDKWEYPWYAAWDLAFHCLPLALVDADFAKEQLVLLTREWYMHPNGQLPAYEWAFGDVNPPVHAWATWRVFQIDRQRNGTGGGKGDLDFLERVFQKLLLNFTWWVNRKDDGGRNIFQGGFLGLDNIGVFDRSAMLPTGGQINQADGTSWMAMYALNMMRIALELAANGRSAYEDLATKFFEHFLHIAAAMTNVAGQGLSLWCDEDQFFYDALELPGGRAVKLRIRSMVGLIPMFAVEVLEPELLAKVPEFTRRMEWFCDYRPDLAGLISRWREPGRGDTRLLSLLRGHRMKRLLKRALDPAEFLSDFGVRALSRAHEEQPYVFHSTGMDFRVKYQPAESDSGLFGGNSNWRGPVWMPVNYLLVESIRRFHTYYGDDFRVECPTGSGEPMSLREIADLLALRLSRLFLKDETGRRPVLAYHPKLQTDPHFRDHVLFHEYFHGDSGRGVGASHQTGWSGLVANLLVESRQTRVPAAAGKAERKLEAVHS